MVLAFEADMKMGVNGANGAAVIGPSVADAAPGGHTPAAIGGESPFTLRLGGTDPLDLRVLRLRGREVLSRPYVFDLVVTAEHTPETPREWLDRPASLVLATAGEPRRIHGLVSEVVLLGATARGPTFRLRVCSRLARLRLRTNARIFQDKTPPQIVTLVLDEAGIAHRWETARDYPVRAYTTQHHETDLVFITRLLAEVGIFYFFEPPGDASPDAPETVVFGDTALYSPLDGGERLCLRPHADRAALAAGDDTVMSFELCERTAPTAYVRREYDPSRPLVTLGCSAGAVADDPSRQFRPEVFEHLGELEPGPLELRLGPSALDQVRRKAAEASGRSTCRRLAPGRRFQLDGGDVVPGQTSAHVVTGLIHEGRAPEVTGKHAAYENRFECVRADRVRLPRRPRRRVRQALETAVVVGPSGSEVHTDSMGRVRVRFAWDREERASCWVRTSQLWSGEAWGCQFVPRVGMEVIVGFLQGDPDQPLILGCVPNATHPPPFSQPTKSGFRSRSTPGGEVQNELTFEDEKGAEQMALHAGRDLVVTAGRHASVAVQGCSTLDVGGPLDERIGGRCGLRVGGDAEQTVTGARNDRVGLGWSRATAGGVAEVVNQGYSLLVGAAHTATIQGMSSTTVGTPAKATACNTFVHGHHVTAATGAVRIHAEQGLVLACGESRIEVTAAGVRIVAARVELEGKELAAVKGKGPSLSLGEAVECTSKQIRLFSESGQLLLDKDARLNGTRVMLNCSDEKAPPKKEDGSAVELAPFTTKLTDSDFTPYANRPYHLVADGLRYEGTTSATGRVEKQIPKETRAVTITVWLGDYPEGEHKTFHVERGEDAADTAAGAQRRLANLGYLKGASSGQMDEATTAALASFQVDWGLSITGKLDAATAERLSKVQGA